MVFVSGMGRCLLWLGLFIAIAGSAQAVPQTFQFVSGTARITANVVGSPTLLVDELVALDGVFFEFDDSPVGVPDFSISIAPTGSIAMNGSYGGFDMFTIESAILSPGAGFSTSGLDLGAGQYSVTMGPVDVDAVYSASDSTNTNPPVNNVPLSFTNNSLNATVNTNLITFEMMGVTLGIVPGAPLGEANNLIVKGDITFVGVIPEPTTAALLGLGLIGLGMTRKRGLRP